MESQQSAGGAGTPTSWYSSPWTQLVFGVICMAMIANMQYGWTLFVNPIDDKYHWGRTAIQWRSRFLWSRKRGWCRSKGIWSINMGRVRWW